VFEYVGFTIDHLQDVIRLCDEEGWLSFVADPQRTLRVLTAPGVTTIVALEGRSLVGFAQMFSDGELQAYLANIAVDRKWRGRGVGRELVSAALHQAGGERVDLLSEDDAQSFYTSFPHLQKPGFRLYPHHVEVDPNNV
jgi:ribosomal protein S18 acetylase RimI-like enzyme